MRLVRLAAWVVFCLACDAQRPQGSTLDGPPADLTARSKELFSRYGAAISAPRPEALAGFYHADGALRVINGTTTRMSRAQLDSVYRTAWTPPAFFAWEDLQYDSLDVGTVVVTGGFRWTPAGRTDTLRYLYAAVLQVSDTGLAIRVEHETPRPPR
jgi:hypothetical protein